MYMRPRKKRSNLPPCIYKKHGQYWLVKRNKWTALGPDEGRAIIQYGRMVSEVPGGMSALIDKALAGMKVSASTAKQYRKTGDKLKKVFRDFSPEQVKGKHVARMKNEYSDTPFYANRLLSLLRLVFAYAVEAQLVESNPCSDIRPHKESARTRYLSDHEFDEIRTKAGPRLQVIMDLLYYTAQRPVDILKLRRDQIREDGIYFEQQKTGARLLVQWTPELKAVVERAKNLHGNIKALTLLHNRRGKAPDYSTINLQWRTAVRAAGILDAQMRDIRARSLTDVDAQGNDAQMIAGHSSPSMTKRYLRIRKTAVASGPSLRHR